MLAEVLKPVRAITHNSADHLNIFEWISELTPSEGKRYCLVIDDMFSKWVGAFPTSKQNASAVAKALLTEIIPCINYRGLKSITVEYPYPLPLVASALEQLRGTRFFTKLDLRSVYNLIRIMEGDEWKTSFHTIRGHYKYLVMPYRLTNTPAVFQLFIKEIFKDLIYKFVIAYIDDILIYSSSYIKHVRPVCSALQRLLQHQLY